MISQSKYNPEFHLPKISYLYSYDCISHLKTNVTLTGLQDSLAFVVRIQSQIRMKGFNAFSALNIIALTTAKLAMKLHCINTQGKACFHLALRK